MDKIKATNETRRDSLWITVALILGAIEPIIVKYGYRNTVDPMQLFVVRNIAAALCLSPFIFKSNLLKILWKIAPVSILLMATSFCTILALKFLSAITVITIVTCTPAVVALINQKLGRDVLAKHFWLGFWMCFIGVIMSLEAGPIFANPIGLACVIIAVLSSSLYRVRIEQITDEVDAKVASAVSFFVIGIISLFLMPMLKEVPSYTLGLGSIVGIFAGLANAAFVIALNRVGATRLSIITMIQRPLLIIVAALILREQPTLIQAIGIVMVIIGMNYAKVTRHGNPVEEESASTCTVPTNVCPK